MLRLAATIVLASLLPALAQAQLFRSYLASDGNDANPCTVAQPCRLLPAALAAVQDGGEIWMLDSANYNTGTVVISKSVTILAIPGALGSVVALGGNAIVMTAGRVTLRNLNVLPFPANPGITGIHVTGGTHLLLEGCHVSGFAEAGLHIEAAVQAAVLDSVFSANLYGVAVQANGVVRITGSHFSDHTSIGIYVVPELVGQTASATVTRTVVANSTVYGMLAYAFTDNTVARLYVTDSTSEGNGQGIAAITNGLPGSSAEVGASNSLVARSATNGLRASGLGAVLLASGNTVVRNVTGMVSEANGIVNTTLTNNVNNNGTDTAGTMTNVGLK